MNKKAVTEQMIWIIISILLGVVIIFLYLSTVYSPSKTGDVMTSVFDVFDKMVTG